MKYLLLFITALFVLVSLPAQKLTAIPTTQDIVIGQPFVVKLQANFEKNEIIRWFEIDSIDHFEILQTSALDTLDVDGDFAVTQELKLTSWDSGSWQMPAFVIGKYQTKPFAVNVGYSQPFDPAQPYRDIKDIIEVKKPEQSNWQWYLIFALLLIGLFVLFFPSGKKEPLKEFVPDEGIFKTSLKQLDELQRRSSIDPAVYYSELINIFRTYLFKRKNIFSYSQTTNDLGHQLESLIGDQEGLRTVLEVLKLSDQVKFAKFQPDATESAQALIIIKESIINLENSGHAV